jgi:hypothetical protein
VSMRVGILVWVTAPAGMSQQQVRRELLACVSFGRPEAHLLYAIDEDDEPDDDPVG